MYKPQVATSADPQRKNSKECLYRSQTAGAAPGNKPELAWGLCAGVQRTRVTQAVTDGFW